ECSDVRVVFGVGVENDGTDLGFATRALGKKWPDGAINLAAGENFALAGTAFTLDETAGDASTGVGVLAVIHRKREEIDAFAGIRIGYGRRQYNVIAIANHYRAVCLLG